MLGVAGGCLQHFLRDIARPLGFSSLHDARGSGGDVGIGRVTAAQLVGQLDFGRILVGDRHSLQRFGFAAQQLDGAPIRECRDREPRDRFQCLGIIERRR